MQGGRGGAMGFGRSKAKLMSDSKKKITFPDVAGVDEAKEEVQEVVEFLKDPRKFMRLGGKIPKGVLLVGPPGTGKTLLAKAIAGEADVPFFTISGSDFVEMFVGVGASRVRDMFEQGKKNAPCIIFVDELDAVGRSRGAGLGGGNDEREQTLNQILVEMDGFETNEGVVIIAATNRPDVLDPALLRPGRFDRQVVVSLPDIVGREQILKIHSKKISLGPNVKLKTIAKGTPGFSGADLANLVNESALLAARKNKRIVTMQEFEDAKDKVMMGAERKSMVMTEDDKKLTAYHESGHAIVALNEKASDPIHKATIIPRGRALGVVWTLPERDKYSHSREYLEANISKAMGGRIAEELIFGYEKVTSGAASDIQMATKLAKDMVTKFGMSNELGPLSYGENEDEVFLGRSITRQQHMSEETAKKVDIEIKKIVDTGYKRAKKILTEKIDDMHKLAKALILYETLTGDEIMDLILKNKYPKRAEDIKLDENDKTSALGSLGLKPKPAH
jgi:cell division protease FtsH